jgi:hypothetical protein
MRGTDLARACMAEKPTLFVLLSCGWRGDDKERARDVVGERYVLSMPNESGKLANLVDEHLPPTFQTQPQYRTERSVVL